MHKSMNCKLSRLGFIETYNRLSSMSIPPNNGKQQLSMEFVKCESKWTTAEVFIQWWSFNGIVVVCPKHGINGHTLIKRKYEKV
jgi:hypothetical protein